MLAREYLDAGISVIPLRLDGSKAATVPWKAYQSRLATEKEISEWFSNPGRPHGIGLVCGQVSGGLEVFDFDDGSLFDPWRQKVKRIVERLPVVETGGGGWHVMFRCKEVGGNNKIAIDPNREKQTLIETRGEGGYIVAEGSPCATHATGLPYVQYSGPYLPQVPTITPGERTELWRAARTFDKRSPEELRKLIAETRKLSEPRAGSSLVNPVVHEFNQRTSWDSILRPHGWTSQDSVHWIRPGKRFGVSARVVVADDGNELLSVFSGNAGPLSADNSYRIWNKFNAWAVIEFGGDNKAAFRAAKKESSL